MPSVLTYQPVKALWTLLAVTFNAARIPLWILYFLPSSLRANKKWTVAQCVRVRLVRAFLWNVSMVEMRIPNSLAPGRERQRFVTLPAARDELYAGVTRIDPEVQPGDVGGTWYPAAPGVKERPDYVCLLCHGGAFVIGDGREEDAGFEARTLIKETDITHVFSLQYRIASNPNCRFPAQLQDAISAYSYLVFTLGVSPSRLVVAGDSAGANLTCALLRYISDHGTSLGLLAPAAALLFSPWPSPHQTAADPTAMNSHPNSSADIVTPAFGLWGARCLHPSPATSLTLSNPYADFLNFAGFSTETPIFFQCGSMEALIVDQIKMFEGLRGAKGNRVELFVSQDAPHDITLTGHLLDFKEEARTVARKAGAFLKESAARKGEAAKI